MTDTLAERLFRIPAGDPHRRTNLPLTEEQ